MSRTELKQVVRAFFNGTGIAFCYETTKEELMEKFEEAIADKTFSSDELDECFRDTAKMENVLNTESKGGLVDEAVYERVANSFGLEVPDFIILWFTRIHLLLKYGRIKNDENFGYLVIDGMSLRESVDAEEDLRKKGYCFNLKGSAEILIYPRSYFPERFHGVAIKTNSKEIEEQIERAKKHKDAKKTVMLIEFGILKYTDQEIIDMDTSDQRFLDWCDDVVLYATFSFVVFGNPVQCHPMTKESVETYEREQRDLAVQIEMEKRSTLARIEREKRELAVKAEQAEKVRLKLEKEEEKRQRKIELAKAEEKRKADEIKAKAKAKAKEASKRNIPPFPPNMKERGKQDSTMVCNKKAQLDWMKKHVPNWDGVLWNKKQANKYIDDIKKGIDVIVCDRIPIAEGFAVYNDDCEGLVQAEASTFDLLNL